MRFAYQEGTGEHIPARITDSPSGDTFKIDLPAAEVTLAQAQAWVDLVLVGSGSSPTLRLATPDPDDEQHLLHHPVKALRAQPATTFLTDPDTALAAAILFDQVPRNIFRGHADAFATDSLARAIARGIVEHGWDRDWPDERRQFAYLPFEHSEDIADQRESLRLFAQFADPMFQDYAKEHFDMIDRFGRFPHRNAVLGRATRPDEDAAIEEGKNW